MTKEAMLNIINKHNNVVDFINSIGDVKIPAEAIFLLMPLSGHISGLGFEITHEARKMGIDVVCCMQSGKITRKDKP